MLSKIAITSVVFMAAACVPAGLYMAFIKDDSTWLLLCLPGLIFLS